MGWMATNIISVEELKLFEESGHNTPLKHFDRFSVIYLFIHTTRAQIGERENWQYIARQCVVNRKADVDNLPMNEQVRNV